jgi:hypothetical protein
MTQEEIRKLLGGYATDSLTEGERAALFEAALDDQELFDALQNEDALRELLADPVTRAQIQQTLERGGRGPSWVPRGWLMGGFGLAAAAAIVIAVFVWPRQPQQQTVARQIVNAPRQMAENRVEPKIEASPAAPAPKPKTLARRVRPRVAATAAPVQAQDQPALLAEAVVAGLPAPVPALAAATTGALYQGPLVRYSVIRSGPAGDAIRLEVVSQLAGNLSLYRRDPEGQWQRLYPVNTPSVAIAANAAYQIPENPIAIPGNAEKLRLVVEPAGPRYEAHLAAGQLGAPRAKTLQKAVIAPPPLVVEIPIGPN